MAFDKGPWPRMRPAERSTVLMQFHDELVARAPEIAILVVKESGSRPVRLILGANIINFVCP
jgi:acyl-CoA reductase-like NAD-dependent aldehyde dehydrogenase